MQQLPSFVERYIERHQWGADPLQVSAGHPAPEAQFVGLVLHHTVMPMLRGETVETYMRRLQRVRPDLGLEVPYSVGVFPGSTTEHCVVAVGRGKGRTGAHTAGLNSTRYGVFVPGDTDRDGFTPGQIAGIRWIGATWLRDPIEAAPTIGHQQAPPYFSNGSNLNATGCPGGTGMAAMPALQPPFVLPPEPSEEDDNMATALAWDGRTGKRYRIDGRDATVITAESYEALTAWPWSVPDFGQIQVELLDSCVEADSIGIEARAK